jgi:two-component system, NarL family, nitrate/nitrite response regulator NarL
MQPKHAQILVASDNAILRRGIQRLFASDNGIRIVAETSDAKRALQLARELEPDILLWDFGYSQSIERRAANEVDKPPVCVRLIAIVNTLSRDEVLEAFRMGAHGIVCRPFAETRLRECVHRVAAGQHSFENEALIILVAALRELLPSSKRPGSQSDYKLTPRELDIIAKIASGRSNREVGEAFSISERTVKHYLTGIFGKLGLSSRLELALFAVNHRLTSRYPASVQNEPARSHAGDVSAP